MDDSEHDQLDDIHNEVAGSNEKLGAIDERTRNIESQIKSLSDEVQTNRSDLDQLQSQVRRNTTIINAVTVGASAFVLWISDKLTRINPF